MLALGGSTVLNDEDRGVLVLRAVTVHLEYGLRQPPVPAPARFRWRGICQTRCRTLPVLTIGEGRCWCGRVPEEVPAVHGIDESSDERPREDGQGDTDTSSNDDSSAGG